MQEANESAGYENDADNDDDDKSDNRSIVRISLMAENEDLQNEIQILRSKLLRLQEEKEIITEKLEDVSEERDLLLAEVRYSYYDPAD